MARTIAKDYNEKRLSILSVAAEVFARDGITRASMNDIAKHGGISKATIYHYYTGKDELLFDILDSYLSELRDRVCQLSLVEVTDEQSKKTTAEKQLYKVTTEILLAYDGMDHQHKIQNEGLPLLPSAQQEILKDYQREIVSVVKTILLLGFPAELENNGKQLRDIAMSIFGMLNWFYMWQPKATTEQRIEYARTVTTMTFKGVSGLR